MTDDIALAVLASSFGWTYNEIMDQPRWFIQMMIKKIVIDGEIAKLNEKKNQSWDAQ